MGRRSANVEAAQEAYLHRAKLNGPARSGSYAPEMERERHRLRRRLYDPAFHEPLTVAEWDERLVRDAIAGIVADVDSACRPKRLWPAHEWDGWQTPKPVTDLYVGAAGVVWALDRLRARGYAETTLDLVAVMRRALDVWRAKPEVLIGLPKPEPTRPALFMGESGILLVLWRLDPSDEIADDLHGLVVDNLSNPANEVMWGTAGTLLAARLMHGWTGEKRLWPRKSD